MQGLNPLHTSNDAGTFDAPLGYVPGRVGGTQALNLNVSANATDYGTPDGAVAYVVLGLPTGFNDTRGWSFGTWYYPKDCRNYTSHQLLDVRYANQGGDAGFEFGTTGMYNPDTNGQGNPGVYNGRSVAGFPFNGLPCLENTWQRLSLTFQDQVMSVYHQGVFWWSVSTPIPVVGQQIAFARHGENWLTPGFPGYVQDAHVWDVPLDAATHALLFATSLARPTTVFIPPPPPPVKVQTLESTYINGRLADGPPLVVLTPGPVEVVGGQGCPAGSLYPGSPPNNIGPDAPVTFYRAGDGTVVMMNGNGGGNYRSLLFPNATGVHFRMECDHGGTFTGGSNFANSAPFPQAYSQGQSTMFATWAMPDVATPYTGTVLAYAQTQWVNASGDGSLPTNYLAYYGLDSYNIGGFVSSNGGTTYTRVATGWPAPATFVTPTGLVGPEDMGNVFQNPNEPGYWYVFVKRGYPGAEVPGRYPAGLSTDGGGADLWRTSNILDNGAWRGWDGTGFTVPSLSPWLGSTASVLHPGTNNSLLVTVLNDYTYVTYNHVCACFIGVDWQDGFGYYTSKNLTSWSQEVNNLYPDAHYNNIIPWSNYPSLFDLDFDGLHTPSVSNYVESNTSLYVYFTVLGQQGRERMVARFPVTVTMR